MCCYEASVLKCNASLSIDYWSYTVIISDIRDGIASNI